MKGIFVTGTNTEVGKTIVTRAIVRALTLRGIRVGALKPVESGAPRIEGHLAPQDALALKKASGHSGALEELLTYCFEEPVSPHLAARRAGTKIETAPLISLIESRAKSTDILLVEGAGGFLVPISDELLYADVVAKTDLGLLIVAPNVLGSINTTLLTIEAARARRISIAGVILNCTPDTDLGNSDAISRHGNTTILGEFPDAENLEDDDYLAELAEDHIDLDRLLLLCDL